jgi:FkbM family methyltransferase
MIKLYDRFERKILIGNSKLQWLFESLHRFSLRGMNYDQVSTPQESGELFVLNYLKDRLRERNNLTLFDVGANVGEYAKLLTTLFPSANVYSFEAWPATFDILTNNVKKNKNIKCFNQALGSSVEEQSFYSDGAGSGLSTFYPLEELTPQNKLQKVIVPTTTIDLFCEVNGIDQIDVLKIDVEGFELEVLRGAEQLIRAGKILFIQFEFGRNHVKSGTHFYDFYKFLSAYKISRVLKDGLRLLENYQATQEIYLSANYFAELKRN